MGILGVSCTSPSNIVDVIRVEQGEIRPCTSFPAACGGTKDCHAEMRRRGDSALVPDGGISPWTGFRAQRNFESTPDETHLRLDISVSLRLRGEFFLRPREEIYRRDAEAPRVELKVRRAETQQELLRLRRAGFTNPPTRTGHAFASASPRLRVSACKTFRGRIGARAEWPFRRRDRSRSGIHNVKEPGAGRRFRNI